MLSMTRITKAAPIFDFKNCFTQLFCFLNYYCVLNSQFTYFLTCLYFMILLCSFRQFAFANFLFLLKKLQGIHAKIELTTKHCSVRKPSNR